MAWVYLIFAGLIEVFWAVCMKLSEGFTVFKFSAMTVAGLIASFLLLSQATKTLPHRHGLRHLDGNRRSRCSNNWYNNV